LAKPALSTTDRKRHHDAVSDLKIRDLSAKLDHFAHVFMTENIAAFHGRLIAVKQMQVGAANRTGCDPDDGVPRMLDLGIGNRVDPNVAFSVPA
jgi:hypothetical protein